MKTPEFIKCRFCEFTCQRWRTDRGRKVHGFEVLQEHCASEHFDEPAVKTLLYADREERI